jgi:hypothetical protein
VLSNAPANGVYSVLVQSPAPSAEPNLTMSFTTTVSHDVVVPLSAGTAASMNLSHNGQHGRFTFAGTTGGSKMVEVGGTGTSPAGRLVSLTVMNPDGTTLTSNSTSGSYTFSLSNLPLTGTYTVFVEPQYGATATLQGMVQ